MFENRLVATETTMNSCALCMLDPIVNVLLLARPNDRRELWRDTYQLRSRSGHQLFLSEVSPPGDIIKDFFTKANL